MPSGYTLTPVAKTIPFINGTSGLTAGNVQDALDELAAGGGRSVFFLSAIVPRMLSVDFVTQTVTFLEEFNLLFDESGEVLTT